MVHPTIAIIRTIIESSGSWNEANEYFVRWCEEKSEWLMAEQEDCDDDDKHDITQAFELPEKSLIDILNYKHNGFTLEQATRIYKITKDYFKTHQNELTI